MKADESTQTPDDAALAAELRAACAFQQKELADSGARCFEGTDRTTSPRVLQPGETFGDYRVLTEVGQGGMGIVYRARQSSLERDVALKILPGLKQRNWGAVARFRGEAVAASRVHHECVVGVYDHGEVDGVWYYAMEFIDGVGLDTIIRRRTDGDQRAGWTDAREMAELLAGLAAGLQAVHDQGIIHRDVKPANVMVGRGRFHLTDFGLARLEQGPALTLTGQRLGTPSYRAPETVRGDRDIDVRSDIYSLGVMLYEMLTGRRPFDGATLETTSRAILEGPLVAPRRITPDVPRNLEAICLKAMARVPGDRYACAADLEEDLRRFASGQSVVARRPGLARRVGRLAWRHRMRVAVAVAVLGLAGSAWAWRGTVLDARQRESATLVQEAWDRLAYVNYREPEGPAAQLARAEALGATGAPVNLVRAIVAIAERRPDDALAALDRAAEDTPADQRIDYLRGWALGHRGDAAEAARVIDDAAPPTTPDGWFFRGLALHRADPLEAIRSYRNGIRLRAVRGDFFPQAALHLARAHNQQLYAERDPALSADTIARLERVVEEGVYGVYPYYLLSIAHRLTAEALAASVEPPDAGTIDGHFAAALERARAGQGVDPDDEMPVTAEAECLEAMGDIAAAIEARTRALDLAASDGVRWDALHYRWRLHYAAGATDAALADLDACADLAPDNAFYDHVYPALVHHAGGDAAAAQACIDAWAATSPDDPTDVIWIATAYRLVGAPARAGAWLESAAVNWEVEAEPPGDARWMRALHELAGGRTDAARLEGIADARPSSRRLHAEWAFHEAARRLADGDVASARDLLERSYRCFDSEQRYTYHAKVLLMRLGHHPHGWWGGE